MLLLPILLQVAQPAPMVMPVPTPMPMPTIAPSCPIAPAALPADLAGWGQSGEAGGIGRAFTLRTIDPATARFAVPIDTRHPGRVATISLSIARAGTYQVAINRGGWIDVFGADRTAVASAAHRHGQDCSGIRKIVSFALQPGSYTLALTGIGDVDVKVLVATAP